MFDPDLWGELRTVPSPAGGSTCAYAGPTTNQDFCGDGYRSLTGPDGGADAGPEGGTGGAEECDMGATNAVVPRLACSRTCQVLDMLAVPPQVDAGYTGPPRTLGQGRHPMAGGLNGWIVAYLEPDDTPPTLSLGIFSTQGAPLIAIPFSGGSTVIDTSNPVVAPLPCDQGMATAWTDFGGDGDELGVAIRYIAAGNPTVTGSPSFANTTTTGSQHDPDIIGVSSGQVVVAWVDDSDAATAPDLRWRTFDATLTPTSAEQTLAATADSEADVALAPFAGSWAAAYRDDSGGFETVKVVAPAMGPAPDGGAMGWTIGPAFMPAPVTAKPALVAIDATHLLVVYAVGTDPTDSGVANESSLQTAVLDLNAPGAVSGTPLVGTLSTQSQSSPTAVAVNGQIYVAWWTAAAPGDPLGEENWVKPLGWTSTTVDGGPPEITLDTSQPELPLPRWTHSRTGDQRAPALITMPLPPDGAIVAAWDDLGMTFGPGEGAGDTALEVIPVPIVRGSQEQCAPGWGDCNGDPDDGCETGLDSPSSCGSCTTSCTGATPSCFSQQCVANCPTGQTRCSVTSCVDTTSDPSNCGACGATCTTSVAGGQPACVNSACTFSCSSGLIACPSASPPVCINDQSDTANCGGCGHTCPSIANGTPTCSAGTCSISCTSGLTYCSATNLCDNTQTDVNNCGACGQSCQSIPNGTPTCNVGTCGITCSSGLTYCSANNFCENTQTNVFNCGACGNACPSVANSTATCTGGTCGVSCNSGFTYCSAGNDCAILSTDVDNCGACGHVCPSATNGTPTCTSGTCGISCGGGNLTYCASDNGCDNLQTDANDCGSCGHACPSVANGTPVCNGATCGISCNAGLTYCSAENLCDNLQTDVNDCGSCGYACPSIANGVPTCTSAVCGVSCNSGYTYCSFNDTCDDLQTNASDCGSCGHACPTVANGTATCNNATCGISCNSGLTYCSAENLCDNLQTNAYDCGTCGHACPSITNGTPVCNSGTCGITCSTGLTYCSAENLCDNLQTDVNDCGSCGHACSGQPANATSSCSGGGCVWSCNTGYQECVIGANDSCIPLADTVHGAFVSAAHGVSTGCGSETTPCLTVSSALANNPSKTIIYVDPGTYTEQVTLPAGVTIEGGWVDTSGTWSNCNPSIATTITAPSGDDRVVIASYSGSSTLSQLTISNENTASAGQTLYGVFATGTSTQLTLSTVIVKVAAGGNGTAGSTGAAATLFTSCSASTGANGTAGATGTSGAGSYTSSGYSEGNGGTGATGTSGTNGVAGGAAGCVTGYSCREVSGSCSLSSGSECGTAGGNGCASTGSAGGTGGTGGGSSIGLFAWGAAVTVSGGSVTTGNGGGGGAGGAGGSQLAGSAGYAGQSYTYCTSGSCAAPCSLNCHTETSAQGGTAGGTGGEGGKGGTGGGGAGGDSHCYAQGGSATVTWAGSCTSGTYGGGAAPNGVTGTAGLHN